MDLSNGTVHNLYPRQKKRDQFKPTRLIDKAIDEREEEESQENANHINNNNVGRKTPPALQERAATTVALGQRSFTPLITRKSSFDANGSIGSQKAAGIRRLSQIVPPPSSISGPNSRRMS